MFKLNSLLLTFLTVFACVYLNATYSLTTYPNTGDEQAVKFQSEIFAEGRLWAHAPPEPAFFWDEYLKVNGDKWYGQFPPLASAMIAPFTYLNAPAVGMAFWGALLTTLLALFCFQLELSREATTLTLVMFASSPSVLFHLSSYYTQVPSALFFLLALIAIEVYRQMPNRKHALLIGLAFGGVASLRPWSAVLLALPTAAWMQASVERKPILKWLLAGLATLPLLSLAHGLLLEGGWSVPYWSAGNNRGRLKFDSPLTVIATRAMQIFLNTGRWLTFGIFGNGTPKFTADGDFNLGAYVLTFALVGGAFAFRRSRLKLGGFAALSALARKLAPRLSRRSLSNERDHRLENGAVLSCREHGPLRCVRAGAERAAV